MDDLIMHSSTTVGTQNIMDDHLIMHSSTVVQHELQDNDILCTQDKSLRNHAGNRFFREFVDRMLPAYKAAENKLEKMNITKNMVDALQETHGYRFVRFDDETASWVEASTLISREKVGHALRNAMRKEHKKALKKLKPRCHQPLLQPLASAPLTMEKVASIELPPMPAKPLPLVSTEDYLTKIAEPGSAATTARPERKSRFSGLFRSLSQGMIDLIENDTNIGEPLDSPLSLSSGEQPSGFKRPSFLSMFRSISQGLRGLIGPDNNSQQLQDHHQQDQQQQQQPPHLFRKKRFSGLTADMFRSFSGGYMTSESSTTSSRRCSTILSEQDLEPLGLTPDRSVSHGLATELLKWANNSDPNMAAAAALPPPTMMESTSSFSVSREESNSSIACESDFRTLDPSETNQFMRSWLEGSNKGEV